LTSALFARFAYIALDGTPRVVPTWFHWTGEEFVMATFVSAPHVRRPAMRLRALRVRPSIAMTIDTDQEPPTVLSVRGEASVTEHPGVVPEYALAAHRYLGDEKARQLLDNVDHPTTIMARVAVAPDWVGLLDFRVRLPQAMGGIAQ
jgi:hypothetical protein